MSVIQQRWTKYKMKARSTLQAQQLYNTAERDKRPGSGLFLLQFEFETNLGQNTKYRGLGEETWRLRRVYVCMYSVGSLQSRSQRNEKGCVRVRVRVRVREEQVCACMCVCMYVCMYACV